ncbi:hypothetical protein F5Y16DRAFT_356092 [Xylariaceae sp. FL0255]|nr:hypothetical protein F5Y16DRAFT_356092 [Xylariaceae sp. FL0255]
MPQTIMASAAQSLRLCLRTASRHVVPPAQVTPRARVAIAQRVAIRPFSSTPLRQRPAVEEDEEEEEDFEDDDGGERLVSPFTPEELERLTREYERDGGASQELATRLFEQTQGATYDVMKTPKLNRKQLNSFWNEEEEDPMLQTNETNDDEFDEDDIMGMAHGKLQEHREYREYARIAAWQMPLLSKLAVPFQPPTAKEPLRFRYTSYMGENHPAEPKVVVEFSPRDMQLSEAQQLKLRKLLGPRWNPETDIAKMSCEQFDHAAQNKRYLSDLVNKLIAEAKDPKDMLEDIPLDTRHHVVKKKPKFPKEWRLTEERMKFIEDSREKALLLDQAKEEKGALINGTEKIDLFFNPPIPVRREPIFRPSRNPLPMSRRTYPART